TAGTAIGGGTKASSEFAFAAGFQSTASGVASVALGLHADASADNAIAIGNGATAGTTANDVALGAGSVTSAPSVGPYTINGGTIAAMSDANGVVSVGAVGAERQIQNLAAG